jgi:hypothetical protein
MLRLFVSSVQKEFVSERAAHCVPWQSDLTAGTKPGTKLALSRHQVLQLVAPEAEGLRSHIASSSQWHGMDCGGAWTDAAGLPNWSHIATSSPRSRTQPAILKRAQGIEFLPCSITEHSEPLLVLERESNG